MWPYPKIIAHRGGGNLAPENTLAAFQCGLSRGFHAVEFDVMLTKDHIPVVIHDEKLGRTVAGKGIVSQILANDLFQMDAGSWFSPEFAGTRVPRYWDVLEFCAQHGIWMNVEIKPARGFEAISGKVIGEVTREFYQQKQGLSLPLFSSFSLEALMSAKIAAPEIPRAMLYQRISIAWETEMHALEAVAVHTSFRHLTRLMVKKIKQAGFGLSCYTVNDIETAKELSHWGVDAFFTDRLDLDWTHLVDVIQNQT